MNKLIWLQFMALPMMQSAVQVLKMRDSNSTGADDEAAKAIEAAIAALEIYLHPE